jgi:hypothetical protein
VISPYGFFLLGPSLTFTRVPRPPETIPAVAVTVLPIGLAR